MTLEDYIQRLGRDWSGWYFSTPNHVGPYDQLRLYDYVGQRMGLARTLRLNANRLKKGSGSSINRTFKEVDKLDDPAWVKLKKKWEEGGFSDCEFCESPYQVMERIIDRTMKQEEYNAVINGTHNVFARKPIVREVGHALATALYVLFSGSGSYFES